MAENGGRREGAGRKPKYGDEPTMQLSHRLPPALVAELRARAKVEGISPAELIVKAVRRYLGHDDPPSHQSDDSPSQTT